MAISKISAFRVIRKTYNATLESNGVVSPFSAFTSLNISSDISNYGKPVSLYVETDTTNPCTVEISPRGNAFWLHGAHAETVTVHATYIVGGGKTLRQILASCLLPGRCAA